MVGGDPCEHPNLVELLKYIKDEGKRNNVKTKTIVLSNTHDYKENGRPVDIKDILPYVDEMDVTVHGSTAEEHDTFNGAPGSYEHVMENVRRFAELKSREQEICAIINVMPHTVAHFEEILMATVRKLEGKLDSFGIQRIAPSGRAGDGVKWFIERQDVNPLMAVLHKMKNMGFGVDFVDVFPWCSVKPEYRYLLREGGCNWGTEVCAVFMDGSVSRCAMSANTLLGNMTALDTPEKWRRFWETEPELVAFRKKAHLDEQCKKCELLRQCGGSCVIARESGDPYKEDLQPIDINAARIKRDFLPVNVINGAKRENPTKGHDYLRKDNDER